MTGFVAEKCSIPRVDLKGFHPEMLNYTQVSPHDTLMHYIKPREKYKIHLVVITQLFLDKNVQLTV